MYRDNLSLDKPPPRKRHWLKRLLRAYIRFDDKAGYNPRFNWALSNRFGDEDREAQPPLLPDAEITEEERKRVLEEIRRRPKIG